MDDGGSSTCRVHEDHRILSVPLGFVGSSQGYVGRLSAVLAFLGFDGDQLGAKGAFLSRLRIHHRAWRNRDKWLGS